MRQAKAFLRDVFHTSDLFSTPKPVELIERILRTTGMQDGIVLDFFAGSGTTAHAVAKLNAEDGGNRKFILVSSTEATEDNPDKNLCRDVCAQRVRRVLGGYTNAKGQSVAGLGGGFAYLRARRVPKHRLSLKLDHPEIWNALQLLHSRPLSPWPGGGFAVDEGDAIAYLADAYPASRTRMDAWLAQRGARPATIYSWSPERYRGVDSPHDWRPIPQHLRERFGR
jgi:adenine-specific DNA-methyltransferase